LTTHNEDTHRELSFFDTWILKAVANRWSADRVATHLSEHTEQDFSPRTVRRRLKGLSGEKQGVPKKYHHENKYLKPIPEHPDNAVNYAVTGDGRAVIRGSDIPLNLSMVSGSSDLGRGFGESQNMGGVRPHKCWSRELISREDGSAEGGLSWGDRRAVLAEKDIGFEEVEKELPNREQSEVGELVNYGRVRLILFENSVLVRYSLPESSDGIFEVLDEWWETRRRALDWLESVFPVKVRSTPLDVSMPLSTQEWGDVRNEFAEWIEENPEFQDDSPNSLFEVKNEEGERVFNVDTSPEDELGNDLAEGEFPHSQFGAGHITNMKQAVKWLATLGVKPQDFTAAQWTRRNQSELQKVVELDAEELEKRVDDLEDSVDEVTEDVDSLESQVTQLQSEVSGLSESVEENREWISDVEERVDDAVNRVDASRQEFHEFEDEIVEEVEGNRDEIDSVEKWFSERVRDTEELVHQRVGSIQDELNELDDSLESNFEELQRQNNKQLEEVKRLTSTIVEGQMRQEKRYQNLEEEVKRLRREKERSVWSKARSSVKSAVRSVRGVFDRIRS